MAKTFQFIAGERVQRKGWQLTALGTVRAVVHPTEYPEIIYIVEWDFRGMEKDLTTNFGSDLIPANLIPASLANSTN